MIFEDVLMVHICGKIDSLKIKGIFPDACNQYVNNQLIGDRQWKTDQLNWIAKIYNDNNHFNDEIIKSIYSNIQNISDNYKIKKNVILSFGDEDNKKLLNNLFNIGSVYLPRFIFVTKKEGNYEFNKKMFITNILYPGLTDEEILCNIKSELWEIDCYYNERGNETCKYLANNVIENIEVSDLSINFLLAGVSRAGKSGFINIVNNSLLALENCEKSSITSKVTEYQIFCKNKTEKDGYIKIIDTPGFNYKTDKANNKKLVDIDKVNDEIFNLIKDYKEKNSFDDIHFVLFFFFEGTPLTGTEKVLEMFMKENYTVLFIVNKSMNTDDNEKSVDIKSTLKFLKDNKLNKLAIEENIIPCNTVNAKRFPGYGIDDIFKRVFDLLTEKNIFYKNKTLLNNLMNLKEKRDKIIDVKGQEGEYNKILNDTIKLKKEISDGNKLFQKYAGEETILEEGRKKAEITKNAIYGLTGGNALIPIPYTDLVLTPLLQAGMVFKILNGYGITLNDLSTGNFLTYLLGAGAGAGTREIGHLGYNYISKKIFDKTAKGLIVQLAKTIASKQGAKSVSESIKFIPIFGWAIGSAIGAGLNYLSTKYLAEKTISFCEKYLRERGSFDFLINKIEIMTNVFKELERLSKKKDWWNSHIKIIKKNN